MTKNKNIIRLLTAGVFFAFFLFGFVDNLKGVTLPAMLDGLDINYAVGGTILSGAYIGFFIATLFTGILSDFAGKKIVILLAGIALVAGIALFSAFSLFIILFASMLTVGFGLGSLELGCNSIVAEIHAEKKGKYLNLLAFFHGLGSMAAPYYAGRMLNAGFAWQEVYRYSLFIVVLLPAFFIFIKYPKTNAAQTDHLSLKEVGKKIFNPTMIWFYLFIAIYCAAEIGIGSWLAEYLQEIKGHSVVSSAAFLSLYFGLMTLGRLLGSFLADRIGYIKIMIICAVFSLLCVSGGILFTPVVSFLLPATGLFFSIMFPTATALVSDLNSTKQGTVLGFFFSFAGLGGMAGPWIIGVSGELLGIGTGFGAVIIYCVLMLACLFFIRRSQIKRG